MSSDNPRNSNGNSLRSSPHATGPRASSISIPGEGESHLPDGTSVQAAWRNQFPAAQALPSPPPPPASGVPTPGKPGDFASISAVLPVHESVDTVIDSASIATLQVASGDNGTQVTETVVAGAPPWLTSMIVHMLAMLILGLYLLPANTRDLLTIELTFSESDGDQLDDSLLDSLTFEDESDEVAPALVVNELPPVDNPLASPPPLTVVAEDMLGALPPIETPTIGLALSGREEGMKETLLSAYGGNARTEAAVLLGLEWLVRQQNRRNGGWSLKGPYLDGCPAENRAAATAMALLAFQGAGHTHQSGSHKKIVDKGVRFLLKQQDKNGSIFRGQDSNHRLYTHAQATIALCELFGMTKDESLREAAQLAIDYAVKIQDRAGGWRYRPGYDSDTSVTGWFVMAFQSGLMAGLEVPSPTLSNISSYLDSVSSENGSKYAYRYTHDATATMTAEALLCRQYLGWQKDDPRLLSGVSFLLDNPITYRDQNIYYWYYATQVLHHMGGPAWEEWNDVMRRELPKHQIREGKERGSWHSRDDRWGAFGGRLFTTSLSVYSLEVYYRHLPIYGFDRTKQMQ